MNYEQSKLFYTSSLTL